MARTPGRHARPAPALQPAQHLATPRRPGPRPAPPHHPGRSLHARPPGRPLTLTDIARGAGASPSALTRLFQQHRETTPMQALRVLRLDAAREKLQQGACESVTEVAVSVGISHLGRFSEYYRDRFGELPAKLSKPANSQPPGAMRQPRSQGHRITNVVESLHM
ncbi:helix-turn-helix transcriptional regulator [Achromobacter xylosoxidans]